MQRHACLLLFIITTDKVLAFLHHQCGGIVHLDPKPTGHISLSVPGPGDDSSSPSPIKHQADQNPFFTVCTWTIDIPSGQMARLELQWLEGGSSISVHCVGDQEQVLEIGTIAILFGCDRDTAVITWRGAGHSLYTVRLSYDVQEVMRNSSEDHTSFESNQELSTTLSWSKMASSSTSGAPVVPQHVQEGVRGMERGIGLERSFPSRPGSGPSPLDHRSPPTSLSGLTMAGPTDRETPPLPQEEPDNGADMPGAAHVTESHNSARKNTHVYFHTQHTPTTDTLSHTLHALNTETLSHMQQTSHRDTLPHTKRQQSLTDTVISSATDTALGTDTHTQIYEIIHKAKDTDKNIPQIDSSVPTSGTVPIPSAPSQPYLLTSSTPTSSWVTDAVLKPHGESVDGKSGGSEAPGRRNQRSSGTLQSSLTLAVTSDPLKTSSISQWELTNSTYTDIGTTASSLSDGLGRTGRSSLTDSSELERTVGTGPTVSPYPDIMQMDTVGFEQSNVSSQTAKFPSLDGFENGENIHSLPPSPSPAATQTQTSSPQSQRADGLTHYPPSDTPILYTQTDDRVKHTESQDSHNPTKFSSTDTTSNTLSPQEASITPSSISSPNITQDYSWTTNFTDSPSSTNSPLMFGDRVQNSTVTTVSKRLYSSDVTTTAASKTEMMVGKSMQGTRTDTTTYMYSSTHATLSDALRTHTSIPPSSSLPTASLPSTASHSFVSTHISAPEYRLNAQNALPNSSHTTHHPLTTASSMGAHYRTVPIHQPSQTSTPKPLLPTRQTHKALPLPFTTNGSPTHKQFHVNGSVLPSPTPTNAEPRPGVGGRGKENEHLLVTAALPSQWSPNGPSAHSPTLPGQPTPRTDPFPNQGSRFAGRTSKSSLSLNWSTTTTHMPKFYIVPDQPAAIRVESFELLLQIVVEESSSTFTDSLVEDTTAWVEPYLLNAPGFNRLLGVWSRGLVVQSLVDFRTMGALDWLEMIGPESLLERTGLAQAVREGRRFRGSKIVNVTVGGLQDSVCEWLLKCPEGYECVSKPGYKNHSCSSVCRSDYCHHHGICSHHPEQPPVCRCIVGEDFWYMGRRCDVKMTRARLVGACFAILVIIVTVIAIVALVAVRRYRAILIQAKVDQTRSSYRRFNHFDELSGRFWLRSWQGSADSLDNPAFTRSDELLHMRAQDRTCCYHDDTLSLASTCPSNGIHVNTVFPHSSQYGLRGSEISMGDYILDSGKASDLSVCSWPVEPIQWTPFPLLQQLASHRTPTVRASRPRSYCEGMELVDLGRSWTA
ncbi:mucin-2 [Lampris incognitus]|uniref:mucin-2 n=1 Tax=Lampris incognitus TaxID=2546036 RepID=UPI0024B53362|nr:mucin-2 [Lampris incognitus]